MKEPLASGDDVGIDHVVALGEASASLGLISTLVFSIAISNLIDYDAEPTVASSICVLALVAATATSCFVMSFALLEYYYAQMLKSRDTAYLGVSDSLSKRAKLKQLADQGMRNVSGLRSLSRNSMWMSLVLLQLAAVAHVLDISEHGPNLFAAAVVILGAATFGLLSNICIFRAEFKEATWG